MEFRGGGQVVVDCEWVGWMRRVRVRARIRVRAVRAIIMAKVMMRGFFLDLRIGGVVLGCLDVGDSGLFFFLS